MTQRRLPRFARWLVCVLALASPLAGRLAPAAPPDDAQDPLAPWLERFSREVDRRLEVPPDDQQRYIALLQNALTEAQVSDWHEQAFVLVDRNPQIQAAFVIVRTPDGAWRWLGASPVSTGKPGTFDHFVTPVGVFAHTLENPDFRAEGTFNENHIRGYGLRGMRVFDFGWVAAERGWGTGGVSPIRLQMHATDPTVLEPRIGRVESKGCVRIPATLNVFLDSHGVLDADYDLAQRLGESLWVLSRSGPPIPWPGRYLVIIDSNAAARPPWSPLPGSTAPAGPSPRTAASRSIRVLYLEGTKVPKAKVDPVC